MFSTVASTVKDVDSTCKILYIPAAYAIIGSVNSSRSRYAYDRAITNCVDLVAVFSTN